MDLSISGLSVTLARRRVLDGVDARLRAGRVTAVLGPNGAGKSTLVKAAAALLARDAGQVLLGDVEVASLDPRTRARRIGYLPQDGAVHWNLRVAELVALGRMPHRAPFAGPSDADRAAVAEALAATESDALADRPVAALSGGERARVLLARVLAGQPEWLLADEPLASLDPAHRLDILERLRGVAAAGAGVVIVLHDLVQAARAADDLLLLDDGRVVAFGPAEEVLTPDRLRAVFGVEILVARDAEGRALPIPVGRAR